MFRWWKLNKLEGRLYDVDPEARKAAFADLKALGGKEPVDLLAKAAVKDKDKSCREAAWEHLKSMNDPSAVAALAAFLSYGNEPDERVAASEKLVEIGDARAVPYLVKAAYVMDYHRSQLAMVRALGSLASPDSVDALIELLSASFWEKTRVKRSRGNAGFGITREQAGGIQARDDLRIRIAAAQSLAKIDDPRAKEALRQSQTDPDPQIRQASQPPH